MKLTKLEHAALILELDGQKLFIDPGSLTSALTETNNAVAVVLTHEHADHWTSAQLDRIREQNPEVRIFGPQGVVAAAAQYPVTAVTAGESIEVGAFTLQFFGEQHAVIHESIPVIDNVGVLVNGELYYGGDSFTVPADVRVGTLAVPAGAPWLKISEVIDYVIAVRPKRSFPTHEMVLSRFGKDLANASIAAATEQVGGEFWALEPGDSLEI
jgi:L-ascorbate metabolism protein UlaG (beta-lactamase superfamily)